jgi:hypothetical protein
MFKLVNHLADDGVDALLGQRSMDGLFLEMSLSIQSRPFDDLRG